MAALPLRWVRESSSRLGSARNRRKNGHSPRRLSRPKTRHSYCKVTLPLARKTGVAASIRPSDYGRNIVVTRSARTTGTIGNRYPSFKMPYFDTHSRASSDGSSKPISIETFETADILKLRKIHYLPIS